ncbi:MAG: COX15/CtaA family protein [Balneolaceae bacterium]
MMKPEEIKNIRTWYWSGSVLVFLILMVGGITRLTGSGLSMVEWKPIMGIIPPVGEAQWMNAFEKYKQFPEYLQRNAGMSLSEFQAIFFWEYLHRLLGRVLGLVFILPFCYFLIKKQFNIQQLKRACFLIALGVLQGLMGWFMVKSGLADVPYVSHYRLAAHLLLAFLIFGVCVYFAIDLYDHSPSKEILSSELKVWLGVFIILLVIQVLWGAFTAGLKAGYIYNTFPKMAGSWIPAEIRLMKPAAINMLQNPAAVQFFHRFIGIVLVLFGFSIWVRTVTGAELSTTKNWALALFIILLIQYALGVFTLLFHVPVELATAHQAMALLLFGVSAGFYHHLQNGVISSTKNLNR